jgi:hypothetical protein
MLIDSETNRWSQQDQRFPKVIYIQEVVIGIHPKEAKRLVRSPNYRSPSGGQAVSCRSWLPEAPAVTPHSSLQDYNHDYITRTLTLVLGRNPHPHTIAKA